MDSKNEQYNLLLKALLPEEIFDYFELATHGIVFCPGNALHQRFRGFFKRDIWTTTRLAAKVLRNIIISMATN
jgi:hypothetical protein